MPTVSVIIPVYNTDPYLRRCLESVLPSAGNGVEFICVDDGSTDTSRAILSECSAVDGRVRILAQSNSGQGAARNRGLDAAKGEYVYFMDSDDELADADVLERLVRECERFSLDVLFFDAETRFDEGVESSAVRPEDYIRRHDYSSVKSGRDLFSEFLENREYSVSPCLAVFRRAFLEDNEIRFPTERIFYEDNIFMTRVMLAAKRASHRPWRFYIRKVHADSTVTSKPTIRHLRGHLACFKDACGLLENMAWESSVRNALDDRRTVYKLNVRRVVDACPELLVEAKAVLPADEYELLGKIMVYPLGEKIVNGFRCLREHGFLYTVRRILFGRRM